MRETFYPKENACYGQNGQFGGQSGAAGRAAGPSGAPGPLPDETEHLYRTSFRRRPGGPAGSPARRPVRRTIRRLARRRRTYRRNDIFALPTAIFPPSLYIPFSYLQLGLGQPLFRAEALSLSHCIVETQKLEDLPFYPTKSKSLW